MAAEVGPAGAGEVCEPVYRLYRSGGLGEGRWDGETLTFPAIRFDGPSAAAEIPRLLGALPTTVQGLLMDDTSGIRSKFDVDGWIDRRFLDASLKELKLDGYWPVNPVGGRIVIEERALRSALGTESGLHAVLDVVLAPAFSSRLPSCGTCARTGSAASRTSAAFPPPAATRTSPASLSRGGPRKPS